MDELSLVACLGAALILLWWWPAATSGRHFRRGSSKPLDALQSLTQLQAELFSATDFTAAIQSTNFDAGILSEQAQQRITQITAMQTRHGTVSSVLLDAVIEEERCEQERIRRWNTAVAGANSSSIVLIVMPALMSLIAQGLGTPSFDWLLSSQGGLVCLAIGGLLIGLSRWSLRRLRRLALNKHPKRSGRSQQRALSADEAANAIFLLSLFLKPDVFGIAIALAARGAVAKYWLRMPSRFSAHQDLDVSWLCCVLAANLLAGLDWLRSVRIASECAGPKLAEELTTVAQRLEWGIEPLDAFSGVSTELDPVLHAIAQTRRSGAPINSVMIERSRAIRIEAHGRNCERIEKLGAAAVVPVAAFQLPAFVVLGLVPFVAVQLGPMLSGFSSTGF